MKIKHILAPTDVPVERLDYNGEETTYITFFEFNQYPALNADDKEVETAHSVQIDIFSQGNYEALVKQTRNLMEAAGARRTFEAEEFEKETGYFHKVLRFSYSSHKEEEE
ncbi:hypothetical protein [Halalkalibacterium halodurans]|uniref:hypothetical protein n=1 Tax=Halalkalibacterium halodurans TaxID=86665 RepID=UPI002AA9FBFF|nr:hypothetical protein [Halalkalibacterium halodurans]MDY7222087.1 hypothetical protein [Halalkalibacterium halodurans]MDY7243894.1 hypothetical protein [Halalkalibacterium halodurans]